MKRTSSRGRKEKHVIHYFLEEPCVSVNFEAQPEAIACFDSLDPEEIIIRLQTISKQTIRPGKTLLFLDEIYPKHFKSWHFGGVISTEIRRS